MRQATPPLERFLSLTRPEGSCLIWLGAFKGSGGRYPDFRPTTRATDPKAYAHRWIYEQMVGPIPEGLELDHVKSLGCVGPSCVNWLHLEAVRPNENQRRTRQAVCRNGHDLTVNENCQWDDKGRRRGCLICARNRSRGYQRRRAVERAGGAS